MTRQHVSGMRAALVGRGARLTLAIGRSLSRIRINKGKDPWVSGGLVFIIFLGLFVGGYYLTYTVFFLQTPLEKVAYGKKGGETEKFIYDGVSYFVGTQLGKMDQTQFQYYVPDIVESKDEKKLELFIRMRGQDGDLRNRLDPAAGEIRITQRPNDIVNVVELENQELQRVVIPWDPESREGNSLDILYHSSDSKREIVVAPVIKDAQFWTESLAGFALAGLGFGLLSWRRGGVGYRGVAVVLVPVLLAFYVHSGAFTSNEYFEGHRKIEGMGKQTLTLLNEGHFKETMYRGAGFALVPLATLAIEGGEHALSYHFSRIYPTSRYIMFAWFLGSMIVLVLVLNSYVSQRLAITTGVIGSLFFPYIVDLYAADADAYLIPLMIMLTGLFIRYVYRSDSKLDWTTAVGIGSVFFVMMTVKVQAAFLVAVIPVALCFDGVSNGKRSGDPYGVVVTLILIVALIGGSTLRGSFQHPDKNIGIEGEKFQSNNIWSMIWSTAGMRDHYTAHWFTVSGGLRNERVSDRTGLRETTYLRHSETAQKEVYKPDVLNALDERPGLFYANAFVRLYGLASRYMKYHQHGALISPWLNVGPQGKKVEISGRTVNQVSKELELIRYGGMWKLSPLVFLTKVVQNDLSRLVDMTLLAISLIGIAFVRRTEIMLFLFGAAVAQYTFAVLMHPFTRYFNFTNIALIIGLSVFLMVLVRALWTVAREVNLFRNEGSRDI